MKKLILRGLAMALMLASGALFWLSHDKSESASTGQNSSPLASDPAIVAVPVTPHFETGLESLPASLNGTQVDDQMEVDAGGHLKVTLAIRNLFDYFLTSVGEEPFDTVAARIHAYLNHRLKDPARSEAFSILSGYLAYWQAAGKLPEIAQKPQGGADMVAVQQRMEQVQALRTEFLSPEVIQAFFADQDAYDRYSLARMQLMQNKTLTDTQRAQQLGLLTQQLPASLQSSLKAVAEVQDLQSLTADCHQRNCSAAELRQIRENLVGPEATDRLEAQDVQNAAWNQRMGSYLDQRNSILKNQGLSETDREQQVDALRNQLFSDSEKLRVAALEHIHDGTTTATTP